MDVDDMGVFVDRIAAAGSDQPTTLAAAQVRHRIEGGATPPGLRRLAEALAATVTELPAQRLPTDEPSSVVEAMDLRNLVVLEDHSGTEVAAAVAALLTAGRRLVVTGPAAPALEAIRAQLPVGVADRVVSRLPAMLPTELRELRKLLVTDTPTRRGRATEQLPDESTLPPVEQVGSLCARTLGLIGGHGTGVVGHLLEGVEPDRLDAVVGVARSALDRLGALGPLARGSWTWRLLADVVEQRHRATFDRLREEAVQAADVLDTIRYEPPVSFVEPLTEDGLQVLFTWYEYLRDGGRPRSFFRTVEQREAQPVLAQIRVAGRLPETADDLWLILRHREIAERMTRITGYCAEIGVPVPSVVAALPGLVEELDTIGAAARSIGALRHDVLFLRPDSPMTPPGIDEAEQVAAEILAFADRTPGVQAGQALDALADALADAAPPDATAPEHADAVAALRTRDAAAYAEAVDALGAARREQHDGRRQAALVARLRATAPTLAAAWTKPGAVAAGLGMACFVPVDALLSQLPPADSADVVLVVGAAGLGVERLLLTAVAPRLVAVLAPGEKGGAAPSLLSVLRKTAVLTIRGGPVAEGGKVVSFARTGPGARAQVG
jgi:hypothetical protein